MNRGFLVIAQNLEDENGNVIVDYEYRAWLLAKCISVTSNKYRSVSVITGDGTIKEEYRDAFDQVIAAPWGDDSSVKSLPRILNYPKAVHATPYEKTILMSADVLVTPSTDLDSDWAALDNCILSTPIKLNEPQQIAPEFVPMRDNGLVPVCKDMIYFAKNKEVFEFFDLFRQYMHDHEDAYRVELKVQSRPDELHIATCISLALRASGLDNHPLVSHNGPMDYIDAKDLNQCNRICLNEDDYTINDFSFNAPLHYGRNPIFDITEAEKWFK
ncbi:MAG: hypothetical protein CMN60_21325 [Sphingobium sp.]|nr:hypothetical protein [Sphingobium sp.]MBS50174.1 hypothetical protein [Sphingobium sp.]|tara:strand:- start:35288 stop:36103 length:816 start_codon:yes stop_codon:yes gene_type:complete